MTDEQQKVVDEWEEKICGDGAGLCPAIDAEFARLLTILENREDDLRQMRKTSKNKSRSMLQQQPEQYRQGLKLWPKFLQAQKNKYDR